MNLFRLHLDQLTRREFLKLCAAGLLGCLLPGSRSPQLGALAAPADQFDLPCRGRILEQVTAHRQPDGRSAVLSSYVKDALVNIAAVTLAEDASQLNRIWYEVSGEGGYLNSASVQPVETRTNLVVDYIPARGYPVEVTVPFTDTIWDHRQPQKTAYRLYYGAVVWVTAVAVDSQNRLWYYLSDEWTSSVTYFGRPEDFHILTAAELAPLSPEVPYQEKRIEVRLKDQLMIAYEGERPVFMSRVSTGTAYGAQTFYTPPGLYHTNGKFPSRHMTHPDRLDPNAYDLPGVPWACYITSNGIAFHGTYWHNDFGRRRSHGCINLNLAASRWVYRWTTPSAPLQERIWLSNAATRVDVIA